MILRPHVLLVSATIAVAASAATGIDSDSHKTTRALQHHGSYIDHTNQQSFELYSPAQYALSDASAQEMYDIQALKINETSPALDRRNEPAWPGHAWNDCTDWMHDWVGGWAGCHVDHDFSAYFRDMYGEDGLRRSLFDLLVASVGPYGNMDKEPRSQCVVSPNGVMCVAWPSESLHSKGLSVDAVVKITEFAVSCTTKLQSSSYFFVDDIAGTWTWLCLSDRPHKCETGLCQRQDLKVKADQNPRLWTKDWVFKRNESLAATNKWIDTYVPWWPAYVLLKNGGHVAKIDQSAM